MFNTGAAICMFLALIVVLKYLKKYNFDSRTTIHSWIGVAAVCVFGVSYLWGATMAILTAFAPDSFIRKAVDFRGLHRYVDMPGYNDSSMSSNA